MRNRRALGLGVAVLTGGLAVVVVTRAAQDDTRRRRPAPPPDAVAEAVYAKFHETAVAVTGPSAETAEP